MYHSVLAKANSQPLSLVGLLVKNKNTD